MKLYHLYPNTEHPQYRNIWGYDCYYSFVIRADSELLARDYAYIESADESRIIDVWLDPEYTICEELHAHGEEGIINASFSAG
jgi:hypothetical protein